MKDLDTPYEGKYQKGFNEGYLISKHVPGFSTKRTPGLEQSAWGQGFLDGMECFQAEKDVERLPWLRKGISQEFSDKSKNKDKDLDKEH